MSSILKALQKLERDREARQAKPADIQRGILRQSSRRSQQLPPWKLSVAVLVTSILTALGSYLIMGRDDLPTGQVASVPAPPITIPAPAHTEVATPPQPATQTPGPLQAISSDRPALTAPRPAPEAPALDEDNEPHQPGEPPRAVAPPVASPPPPVAAPPQISVAGIGWRDDPASRMAMVNGSAVRVGGTVLGARVEEILPDRVRFSFHGRTFEVAVGASEAVQQ